MILVQQKVINKCLAIGDSILKNMKLETPVDTVRSIPGARAGDIEVNLKFLAKAMEQVCNFTKIMSYSVVFSDPIPSRTKHDMFSCMSLIAGCPSGVQHVSFINKWKTFWEKHGLVRRDSSGHQPFKVFSHRG